MEFKTLIVYQKAKELNKLINDTIVSKLTDRIIKDQLRRASLSIDSKSRQLHRVVLSTLVSLLRQLKSEDCPKGVPLGKIED